MIRHSVKTSEGTAYEINNINLARIHGVNEKEVREWRIQEATLKTIPGTQTANKTNPP